uniref:Thymidine kinase n=1 Tax=Suid herpesvirus 1 TaxID=10345 RepID=A0A059TAZ0_SUHV|nr:thymidine kinase [Suid alphaherpesvirus 1]
MRILRIYLDGAYGTGKSTTARVMALGGALYVPEPMAYWRTLFDTDTVAGIYDAQTRKQNGSLSEEDAALVTAQHQAAFATPYLLLHTRLVPLFGPAVEGPPEMTVVFDRHPVAATVCFPLARFIVGDISAAAFVGLAATLPGEPPGGNLVVASLDPDEHLRRLRARARAGEHVDARLLTALRNVYAMLVNTSRYLSSGRRWRDDWGRAPRFDQTVRDCLALNELCRPRDDPELQDTLFGAYKAPELCDRRGRPLEVHAWAMDALVAKLLPLRVSTVDLGPSPRVCAAAVAAQACGMEVTESAYGDHIRQCVCAFTSEMGV